MDWDKKIKLMQCHKFQSGCINWWKDNEARIRPSQVCGSNHQINVEWLEAMSQFLESLDDRMKVGMEKKPHEFGWMNAMDLLWHCGIRSGS